MHLGLWYSFVAIALMFHPNGVPLAAKDSDSLNLEHDLHSYFFVSSFDSNQTRIYHDSPPLGTSNSLIGKINKPRGPSLVVFWAPLARQLFLCHQVTRSLASDNIRASLAKRFTAAAWLRWWGNAPKTAGKTQGDMLPFYEFRWIYADWCRHTHIYVYKFIIGLMLGPNGWLLGLLTRII